MTKQANLELNVKAKTTKASKGFKTLGQQGKKSLGSMEKAAKQFSLAFKVSAGLIAGKAILGGFKKLSGAIGSVIDASNVQAGAVNNLNTQLKLAGDFSEVASSSMQQFASDLQLVSTQGDEATLELLALAKTFGTTNNGAKKLTLAATELSASIGVDQRTALKLLGKSYSGVAGRLSEYGISVSDLTKEQLESGAAIDLVLQKFGGAATSKLNTFKGVTDSLANAWGDLSEQVGDNITKSPALIASLGKLGNVIDVLGKFLSDNKIDIGGILAKSLEIGIKSITTFAKITSKTFRFLINNTVGVIKAFAKLGKFLLSFDTVATAISAVIVGLGRSFGFLLKGINFAIKGFTSLAKLVGADVAIIEDMTSGVDSFAQSLDDLRISSTTEGLRGMFDGADKGLQEFQDGVIKVDDTIQDLANNVTEAMTKSGREISKTSKDLAKGLAGPQINQSKNFFETIGGDKKAFDGLAKSIASTIASGAKTGGRDAGIEAGKQVAQQTGNALATAFGGPLGGAVFDIFANLSQLNKEQMREFIDGLVDGVVLMIETIADNADVIVEALVDSLITRGGIVRIAAALVKGLVFGGVKIGVAIFKAINAPFANMLKNFIGGLLGALKVAFLDIPKQIISGFKTAVNSMVDALKKVFAKLNPFSGGGGGILGSIGGAVSSGVSSVAKVLGFNKGGLIPAYNTGGFIQGPVSNSDSVLTYTTPGEYVVPKEYTGNFLSNVEEIARNAIGTAKTSGPQTVTVQVVLNEDVLAETFLNLSQNNARLTA